MTTVIDRHRIRKDCWTLGLCERCGGNPEEVPMVKQKFRAHAHSREEFCEMELWVCPKCGYTKRL